ncbi:MAG: hypothetical protein NWS46_04810 [Cyclobacteriaceae bacterium]|jgi:apolipoprotein N-acyltransferase|nr:hypothetical protein [Cyclobacteriaceae bacterium]
MIQAKYRLIKKIVLALCTPILLIAAWPPSNLNFLLFFAFVPILLLVFDQQRSRSAFVWFYLSFQLFLIMLHATLIMEGGHTIPLVIGILIVPFFWSIPIIVSFKIAKKFGYTVGLFLFPFLYLSQEIVQYYWDFGMTYFNMGVGLSNTPLLLGIYPYFGQEGGTLLVMLMNVSLVILLSELKKHRFRIIKKFSLS